MIDPITQYILEQSNDSYVYHYTMATTNQIKKNGLLSLYGLYHKNPKEYKRQIKKYLPRIESLLGYKGNYSLEDVMKFFKKRNLDMKSIFFSFWEVMPGLHKGRDEFINDATLVRVNIKHLKPSWGYNLITGGSSKPLSYNKIKTYCNMDSTPFQKKQGGRFLFSHIPHLSVIPDDGIIPIKFIEI